MDTLGGELSYHFNNTVMLTALVAVFVLWRYRAVILRGMTGGIETVLEVPARVMVSLSATGMAEASVGWEERARRRLALAWLGGVAVCALVLASVYAHFSGWEFSPASHLMLTLVFTTAAAPVIAVSLGWPWWRGLVMTVLLMLASALTVLAVALLQRAIGGRPIGSAQLGLVPLYFQLAWNMLWLPGLLLLVTGAARLRGVAPITLAALLVFGLAPFVGGRLSAQLAATEAGSLWALRLGHYGVFLLIALPVGWLAWRRIHGVARAYAEKRFSDVQLLARSWWLLLVGAVALELISARPEPLQSFAACVAAYLAFAPASGFVLSRFAMPAGRPPARTLLLLRMFGYTARTERLFDRIGTRWRLLGPVTMIAAPDVIARTIDPGDYLRYLTGRVDANFVTSRESLDSLVDTLDLAPDPDGRYRINEFCCRAASWQATVVELMQRADAVIMDLRGFSAARQGCAFELAELGARLPPSRLVMVVDAHTDRALIAQHYGESLSGVRMLEVAGSGRGEMQDLFKALVEAADGRAVRTAVPC